LLIRVIAFGRADSGISSSPSKIGRISEAALAVPRANLTLLV
jgi:hypothetical protein